MEIKYTRKGDTWHIGVRICSVKDPSPLSFPFLAHLVQREDKDKSTGLLSDFLPVSFEEKTWKKPASLFFFYWFCQQMLRRHRHIVFLNQYPDFLLLTVHRKQTRTSSWKVLITQTDGTLSGKKTKWAVLIPSKRSSNHRSLNKRIPFIQWSIHLAHICQGNIRGGIYFAIATINMNQQYWSVSLKQCFRADVILKTKDWLFICYAFGYRNPPIISSGERN